MLLYYHNSNIFLFSILKSRKLNPAVPVCSSIYLKADLFGVETEIGGSVE